MERAGMGHPATRRLATVALVVADYDEAIRWYTDKLGFVLVEDTDLGGGKRWVVVGPAGGQGAQLLLARAEGKKQAARIGDQTGGRVFLFLETDDFSRDHALMLARGVEFREAPRHEAYGTVAVFADLYGNLWDLIEPTR
jgi:catechol 2,3-dioxygenase-like lactoylglutathione lyase family enzyme